MHYSTCQDQLLNQFFISSLHRNSSCCSRILQPRIASLASFDGLESLRYPDSCTLTHIVPASTVISDLFVRSHVPDLLTSYLNYPNNRYPSRLNAIRGDVQLEIHTIQTPQAYTQINQELKDSFFHVGQKFEMGSNELINRRKRLKAKVQMSCADGQNCWTEFI